MQDKIDIYDDFAHQCADMVAAREEAGIENEPIYAEEIASDA